MTATGLAAELGQLVSRALEEGLYPGEVRLELEVALDQLDKRKKVSADQSRDVDGDFLP